MKSVDLSDIASGSHLNAHFCIKINPDSTANNDETKRDHLLGYRDLMEGGICNLFSQKCSLSGSQRFQLFKNFKTNCFHAIAHCLTN